MSVLEIETVYVGRPSVLAQRPGGPVLSGIVKRPVTEPELALSEVNLAGDEQADLTVHGGPNKAVYVYPREHYAAWNRESFPLEPGATGENLSVTGADEQTVRIGDRWRWGAALLAVSQPRTPCYKLALRVGRKDMVPAFIDSARCGWYLRVLRTATVPTAGPLILEHRDPAAPTVAETFLILYADPLRLDQHRRAAYLELAERIMAAPALSENYRDGLRKKLDRLAVRDPG